MELRADTDAGAEMVEAATRFADDFAAGAMAHDRDGTFAVEHLREAAGRPVPGRARAERARRRRRDLDPRRAGGVVAAGPWRRRHDDRREHALRRADQHGAVVAARRRAWRRSDRPRRSADALRGVVAADVVFAAAASEPSPQDLTRPSTTATRVGDGWAINGRKAFATMAPAATILNVAVSYVDGQGRRPVRVRPRARPRAPASSSTTTGTRSACVPRRPGRCRSRTSGSAPTACATGSRPASTRRRCSTATSSPVRSTPRRRSASPRPPTRTSSPRSAGASTACWPTRTRSPSWPPTSSTWRRCVPRSTGPDTSSTTYVDAHLVGAADVGRGAGRLRRGAGVQGVPHRGRRACRRPGDGAQRRRRLPRRAPAGQGLAGRPSRRLHAPGRRQPGRRPARPHRARRRRPTRDRRVTARAGRARRRRRHRARHPRRAPPRRPASPSTCRRLPRRARPGAVSSAPKMRCPACVDVHRTEQDGRLPWTLEPGQQSGDRAQHRPLRRPHPGTPPVVDQPPVVVGGGLRRRRSGRRSTPSTRRRCRRRTRRWSRRPARRPGRSGPGPARRRPTGPPRRRRTRRTRRTAWPPRRPRRAGRRRRRRRRGRRRSRGRAARCSPPAVAAPDRRRRHRRARRYQLGGLVEPPVEQGVVGADHAHLRRDVAAGPLADGEGAGDARAVLGEVAGHPRGVRSDRPRRRRQRAAVVGIGVRHPLRPRQHVGAQAQEAVVEQGGDQTAGELDLAVVEQPAERGAQLGERVVDLGEHAMVGRLEPAAVGVLDPLDAVTCVALAGELVPGPSATSCSAPNARSVSSSTYRRSGARITSERSTSWSSAAVAASTSTPQIAAARGGRERRRRRPTGRRRSAAGARSSSSNDHDTAALSDPWRVDVR